MLPVLTDIKRKKLPIGILWLIALICFVSLYYIASKDQTYYARQIYEDRNGLQTDRYPIQIKSRHDSHKNFEVEIRYIPHGKGPQEQISFYDSDGTRIPLYSSENTSFEEMGYLPEAFRMTPQISYIPVAEGEWSVDSRPSFIRETQDIIGNPSFLLVQGFEHRSIYLSQGAYFLQYSIENSRWELEPTSYIKSVWNTRHFIHLYALLVLVTAFMITGGMIDKETSLLNKITLILLINLAIICFDFYTFRGFTFFILFVWVLIMAAYILIKIKSRIPER